jgi:hypothetical protein
MLSSADDDDIRTLGPGSFEDRFRRLAMPDKRGRPDAGRARSTKQDLEAALETFTISVSLGDSKDLQDRAISCSKCDRLLVRTGGRCIKVGGQQDAADGPGARAAVRRALRCGENGWGLAHIHHSAPYADAAMFIGA